MQRLFTLALPLAFALATPAAAQSTSGADRKPLRYGPADAPAKPVRNPAPSQPSPAVTTAGPVLYESPGGSRLIAAEQLSTGALFGIGLFRVAQPTEPFGVQKPEPGNSRIAAVGFSVNF